MRHLTSLQKNTNNANLNDDICSSSCTELKSQSHSNNHNNSSDKLRNRAMNAILTIMTCTSSRAMKKMKKALICLTVISLFVVFYVTTDPLLLSLDNEYMNMHPYKHNKLLRNHNINDNNSIQNLSPEQISCHNSIQQHSNLTFVGFWHIGGSNYQHQSTNPNDSRDAFVLKQLSELQSTQLLSTCNHTSVGYNVDIHYVTRVHLNEETKEALSQDGRIHELPPTAIPDLDEHEEYYEFTTLMELYSYCQHLPQDVDVQDPIVFYIHTKSLDEWRIWMEHYLLGPECISCLSDSTKMACGPSLIDDSWIWQHFSGNFFMTRCRHVRTLNPPFAPHIMEEIHDILRVSDNVASGFPHSFPPYGRYVAEYWLMNDKKGVRVEHDKEAKLWPNLRNPEEGHHEALIKKEDVCTRHVPPEISIVK